MSYIVVDRSGQVFPDADGITMDRVLAELSGPAEMARDHVSLVHESGWTLAAHPGGQVQWMNHGVGAQTRFRTRVERVEVRRLWDLLSRGDVQPIEALAWELGEWPESRVVYIPTVTLEGGRESVGRYDLGAFTDDREARKAAEIWRRDRIERFGIDPEITVNIVGIWDTADEWLEES